MIKFIKNFREDESGAVTVDWVVLTAAVAALAGVVYTGIQSGTSGLVTTTSSYLTGTGTSLGTTGAIGSSSTTTTE
ncbi:hypothetical protein GFB49_13175 [Epibacterium sp. SM1979]|uniref:Flp pilus assembly protein, pilin Flp n=1 Tax=Tritonibacter litoralis TaxID=2662264 RepID=A0A843YJJ5_9RHOB|nr:hypothetical protein [Tritonibacter litoralis]MQQ09413.1 hypothetical protein [Tritonibacter litoralis]